MAHLKFLTTTAGLAFLAACSTTPEPICDRDVKIDKFGNVELAECDDSLAPGEVGRAPFGLDLFTPSAIGDADRRDRRERRQDTLNDVLTNTPDATPVVADDPLVLADGGAITEDDDAAAPQDPGLDNPAPAPDGNDDTDDTPTSGGNDEPAAEEEARRPSTPEERAERRRLHHALREAKIERRTVNDQEKVVRAQLENTPKSDADYQRLRDENSALRAERERLQDIQDERQEEFDNFMADWPN